MFGPKRLCWPGHVTRRQSKAAHAAPMTDGGRWEALQQNGLIPGQSVGERRVAFAFACVQMYISRVIKSIGVGIGIHGGRAFRAIVFAPPVTTNTQSPLPVFALKASLSRFSLLPQSETDSPFFFFSLSRTKHSSAGSVFPEEFTRPLARRSS